jgi:hypothetical protein
VVLAGTHTHAAVIRIEADGTGDAPTIQAGIQLANTGDVVELGDGVYTGAGNRGISFLGKAITVRSASGDPDDCVIDCEGAANGFSIILGEGPSTVLQDVRIINGNASRAGGIDVCQSSPFITGVVIEASTLVGTFGSGGILLEQSSTTLDGCVVTGNSGGVNPAQVTFWNGTTAFTQDCVFAGSPDGVGVLASGTSVILNGCTIAGNAGAGVRTRAGGSFTLENSIVAFNGQDVSCGAGSGSAFCSDVFGNLGGDWTGCLTGEGTGSNFSADPLFCDLPGNDFGIPFNSPCAPPGVTGCGLVGAWPVGCGPDEPMISAVTDVPNDQGRAVRVTWDASRQDGPGTVDTITDYAIYRKIDPLFGPAPVAADEVPALARMAYPPGDWDFVALVPARGELEYNTVVPTLCDSTDAGICLSTFFVSALTSDPLTFFDGDPVAGYSVDNLAPMVPTGLAISAPDLATWDDPVDSDFQYFRVYLSDDPVLSPDDTALGETVIPEFALGPQTHGKYVFVTAVDFNGNESDGSLLVNNPTDAPVISGATTFALESVTPNPFGSAASVRLALPREARAVVEIVDVTGRRVRTLHDGTLAPGRHEITWSGDDASGRPLAAGIYFVRMTSNDFRDTKRVVLLR